MNLTWTDLINRVHQHTQYGVNVVENWLFS